MTKFLTLSHHRASPVTSQLVPIQMQHVLNTFLMVLICHKCSPNLEKNTAKLVCCHQAQQARDCTVHALGREHNLGSKKLLCCAEIGRTDSQPLLLEPLLIDRCHHQLFCARQVWVAQEAPVHHVQSQHFLHILNEALDSDEQLHTIGRLNHTNTNKNPEEIKGTKTAEMK